MLVVDASALIETLLGRPAGRSVEAYARDHGYALHAPHLVDVEVLSALRRLASAGALSATRAIQALDDFRDLPLDRYGHDGLVPRMWELRDNFSAYDAAYLALAEALAPDGAALLTCDRRFANAARTHGRVAVLAA